MYGYQWSAAPNGHGVPGSVVSSSRNAATHGSASPYDVNNCLVAWGKGIARGITSAVPCGVVDIAPTALHLMGIQPPDAMQGRVLRELLEGGPLPETVTVRRETREWDLPASSGTRRQAARYSEEAGPVHPPRRATTQSVVTSGRLTYISNNVYRANCR